MTIISCRARVVPTCRREWEAEPEDSGDSTLRAGTVVCFACYIAIEPFMRMNMPNVPAEVDRGIAGYKAHHA